MAPVIVKTAIARIQVTANSKNLSSGTGFLVGSDLVLTALHVVGWRNHTPPDLYDGEITLTFPGHTTKARLYEKDGTKYWNATQDWALLQCKTAPAEISPLVPGDIRVETATGAFPWQAYGFPVGKQDGIATDGTITDLDGNLSGARAFQLHSQQADGFWVSGWSGSPVLVDGHAVGILRWASGIDEQVGNQRVTVGRGGILYACPLLLVWEEVERLQPGLLPKPSPCGGPEKQINLEDLQQFLMRNFDAAGLAALAGALGVQQTTGDVAAQARSMIYAFEMERRLDVLVAEALKRAPHDSQPIRRVPLSEELRELLGRRAAQYREPLRRIDRAIAEKRIQEGTAETVVRQLQNVLQRIRSKDTSLDGSDLPGIAERAGRFLEVAGNSEGYKLSVTAPMIGLVLASRDAINLPAGEIRDLRRSWNRLAQQPLWKRPPVAAAAAAALVLIAFLVAETGWRWPVHLFPGELFASLPANAKTWFDDFKNPNAGKWQFQHAAGSNGPYLNQAELQLPKDAIAWPVLQGALYDFGMRFRFRMKPGTTQVSWFFRVAHSGAVPRGWRFTLTRKKGGDGKAAATVERSWCEGGSCTPVNTNNQGTFKDLTCDFEQASDFLVNAVYSGKRLEHQIYVFLPGSDDPFDEFEPDFWEDRWAPPRARYGGLAFGLADGDVSLVSDVTIYPAQDAEAKQ